MCSVSNSPSLKERVRCYINKRDEIVKDYKNRLHALDEEARTDILTNCPTKIGDVYYINIDGAFGPRCQYYKIAKLDTDVSGTVTAYGYKRKLDGTWGKRNNNFIFMISIYNNYNTGNYIKVENYVEPNKD